jgi:hypothetical protein
MRAKRASPAIDREQGQLSISHLDRIDRMNTR